MRVVYSARSLALLTAPLKAGGGQDQGRRSVIGRKGILSRIPLRIVVRVRVSHTNYKRWTVPRSTYNIQMRLVSRLSSL